jgi:2-succinyl-5-enolpyruvyl-6-hydroxy-3-cyclohexene-1-carboxylate synthase
VAENVASTFCATLVDEWIARGVRHAVVAPGSRSTPLALALAARTELAVHVFHDERSASFAALGLGRSTGVPAVVICTSGTAAAQFHAAVAEADLDEVPLIVCTADRPPELRDVLAPQAIDQNRLYGSMTRWFVDPGVPDAAMRGAWRSIARRAAWTAAGERPGPVHLNLPFREPLVGDVGALPAFDAAASSSVGPRVLADADVAELAAVLESPRGVIVAGGGSYDGDAVLALAASLGWPVLADARSPARRDHPNVIGAFDGVLRHTRFAGDHKPLVVLRVGSPALALLWCMCTRRVPGSTLTTSFDTESPPMLQRCAEPWSAGFRVLPERRGWLDGAGPTTRRKRQSIATSQLAQRSPNRRLPVVSLMPFRTAVCCSFRRRCPYAMSSGSLVLAPA